MSSDPLMQSIAENRAETLRSLRGWACCNCITALIYLGGTMYLLYYVHWQLDFVFSPGSGLQMSDVNYYNCNATLEASTAADYMSGASWALYGEDILRLLIVLATLGYGWLAVVCGIHTSWPIVLLLILFGLYDLGKAIYVTLIYTNSISPACQEYPFCTSHDYCTPGTQVAPGTPAPTFGAEMYASYAFAAVELVWACTYSQAIPKKRRASSLEIIDPQAGAMPIGGKLASDRRGADDDDEFDRAEQQQPPAVVDRRSGAVAPRKRVVAHPIPRFDDPQ